MLNVTLKGLPAGNADLYYAARVEPYRQRLIPLPTPLSTHAVSAAGEASFNLANRIKYAVFGSDGKGCNVMVASTRGWPS